MDIHIHLLRGSFANLKTNAKVPSAGGRAILRLLIIVALIPITFGALAAPPATATPQTLILAPDGGFTSANDMNDSAEVIGLSTMGGFKWSPSQGFVTLATLPTAPIRGSEPRAINNCGEIVGIINDDTGTHAVRWSDATQVEVLFPSARASYALGINDSGVIVGTVHFGTSGYFGYTWSPTEGITTFEQRFGRNTEVVAINNRGQLAIQAAASEVAVHAFYWDETVGYIDLGTLGGLYSNATSINDAGEIVGTTTTADELYHAFRWSRKTGMIDLGPVVPYDAETGTLYMYEPRDINRRGEIAGSIFVSTESSGYGQATFWDKHNRRYSFGRISSTAVAINNKAQIAGNVSLNDSTSAAIWSRQPLRADPHRPKACRR